MKNVVLAFVVAVTSAFAYGMPAQAAMATYRSHVGPHCYVKRVKHYSNGRVWYRNVRVCR